MTPREGLEWLGQRHLVVGGCLAAVPLAALALGRLHRGRSGERTRWKYAWTLVIYAACVPGIVGSLVTAYLLAFTRVNLPDANALATVAQVGAMLVTLRIARRRTDVERLPGVGPLPRLCAVLALSFLVLLALSRTPAWRFVGGSAATVAATGASVFALLKAASACVSRTPA